MERMACKGIIPPLLLEVQTWTGTVEIRMMIFRKIRNQSTIRPNNTTFGNIPKIYSRQNDICSTMSKAALIVVIRTWKQTRIPSTEEWIKKNVIDLHNGVLLSVKKQ